MEGQTDRRTNGRTQIYNNNNVNGRIQNKVLQFNACIKINLHYNLHF